MNSLYAMHVLLFLNLSLSAQPHPDSIIRVADLYPIAFYKKKLEPSTRFFNGREYKAYQSVGVESPYLFTGWTEAELEYDGQRYDAVPIMVDLRNGAVIIGYRNGLLQLVGRRLSQFTIRERRFVFLQPAGLNADFYELLYEGNIKLYSRRQKKLKERIDGTTVVREFEEHVRYYLKVKEELHAIKSKNDFLKLFANDMPQLKAYISIKKLSFRKNFEKDLIVLSMYCDQLGSVR